MKQIEIGETTACEAHDTIGGNTTKFAQILADSRRYRASGPVQWHVPVTPKTVHRVEGIHLLANDEGCTVKFEPVSDLCDRELAFFQDFLEHGVDGGTSAFGQITGRLNEYRSLIRECLEALLRACLMIRSRRLSKSQRLKTAVLIGAYGGEHIGDVAILGGVLLNLHKSYGTEKVHLFSHRPAHTQRLALGMDTPVSLSVLPYQPRLVDRLLDEADALVLAGGPLMDLPRVLVKHLAAVCSARRRGRPFYIERVGVGPFQRSTSRWIARRIAQFADQISVRTSGAATDSILSGLDVRVSQDPAFDYLSTRHELSLLRKNEIESISSLLRCTDNRIRVAINLRPIRHLWSKRGSLFSKRMETRFMSRLAEGLVRFEREAPRPVSYIYFPMNPIQVGFSDLASAYRLHRLLGKEVDLRVWEADPDVDGVLHLLRNMDMAVTMRFHASVFALSQNLPTIGIDYYPGQGGKVEQLFHDLGRSEDVRRIDQVEVAWLINRLRQYSVKQ